MDADLPIIVSPEQSFVRFVYPFIFDSERFADVIEKTQSAKFKADEGKFLTVWQAATFPKEDLLPHVSRYLNPLAEDAHPTAKIWNLTGEALSSFHGLGNRAAWKHRKIAATG